MLTDAWAYLEGVGKTFTTVMALVLRQRWSENGILPAGVEPETIKFKVAKSVGEHVKIKILTKAGFDDIEVAIWEFAMSFSGAGPKLPSRA